MRVTVCELPHEAHALHAAWAALGEHARAQRSELVLLPEFAGLDPVWESKHFDAGRWDALLALSEIQLRRLPELGAEYVVGTRPASVDGCRLNQGFLWSRAGGLQPLRSKYFLPDEPGNWEATWFHRGDPTFPGFRAGRVSFGLHICTELWALETYAAYAALGVEILLAPRATSSTTAAKWQAAGVVAAVRSGAYSLSSNRVETTGASGGMGWIIDPTGDVLAMTSAAAPFATRDLELSRVAQAKQSYPRYVFNGRPAPASHPAPPCHRA